MYQKILSQPLGQLRISAIFALFSLLRKLSAYLEQNALRNYILCRNTSRTNPCKWPIEACRRWSLSFRPWVGRATDPEQCPSRSACLWLKFQSWCSLRRSGLCRKEKKNRVADADSWHFLIWKCEKVPATTGLSMSTDLARASKSKPSGTSLTVSFSAPDLILHMTSRARETYLRKKCPNTHF